MPAGDYVIIGEPTLQSPAIPNSGYTGHSWSRLSRAAAAALCMVAIMMCFALLDSRKPEERVEDLGVHRKRVQKLVLANRSKEQKPDTQEALFLPNWGLVNPDTGIPRVQCGDSVSWGSYGSRNPVEVDRFHGAVGQTFTVECPAHCSVAPKSIYGCGMGPYLDESPLCMAAIGAGVLSDGEPGVVTFTLVEPQDKYKGCAMTGVKSSSGEGSRNIVHIIGRDFKFHEWGRAEQPHRIERYCGEDWVASHSDGEACEAVLKRYRQVCTILSGMEHCYGGRAFTFFPRANKPAMEPDSGTFLGSVQVTVTADDTADAVISCSVVQHKGVVDVSHAVTYDAPIHLQPGHWTVRCHASGPEAGMSFGRERAYVVQARTEPPHIEPTSGESPSEVTVTIACALGATAHYTLDGSDPSSEGALEYRGPIAVVESSPELRALCTRPDFAPSDQAHAGPFTITASLPAFVPDGGEAVGQAWVRVGVQRPSEQAYCTVDGTQPSAESARCDTAPGVRVDRDGAAVSAIVLAPGLAPGPMKTSEPFHILAPPPMLVPNGGEFVGSAEVRLVGQGNADKMEIYYTLDGSLPSPSSLLYSGPFTLQSTGVVVSAMAVAHGLAPSRVNASRPFLIRTSPPAIHPDGGSFSSSAVVTLQSPDPGAVLHYTLDGSDPSPSSPQYNAALHITASGSVLTVVAIAPGKEPSSPVASRPFSIDSPPPLLAIASAQGQDGTCVGGERAGGAECGGVCGACADAAHACFLCSPTSTALDCVSSPSMQFYCAPGPPSSVATDQAVVVLRPLDPHSVVFFTTDGTTPTPSSPRYNPITGAVVRETRAVVHAIAVLPARQPSAVVSSGPIIIGAATPDITPDGGTFVDSVTVHIVSSTPGATIHYTLDGSEPSAASAVYAGSGLVVGQTSTTVRAVAVHPHLELSSAAQSAEFVIRAAAPTFRMPADEVSVDEAVVGVSTSTAGAEIRCTTDGSDPTADSPVCESPVRVTETGTVVKAMATKEGLSVSEVTATAAPLVISTAAPTFAPDGGHFTDAATVVMTSVSQGAQIWFTLDGSEPTTQSVLYTGPTTLTTTGTRIRAVAQAAGKTVSAGRESRVLTIASSAVRFVANGTRWATTHKGVEGFVEQALVEMTCRTPTATIYYTTDGSVPSSKSSAYTGEPIVLNKYGDVTVRALSMAAGMEPSPVRSSLVYDIFQRAAAPEISPRSTKPFVATVTVTVHSLVAESTIHITLDGSEPTRSSEVYREPVTITHVGTTEVKALVVKSEVADSDISSQSFTVLEQVANPSISPSDGTFTDTAAVSITCATPDAVIRYTTDGSEPNAASAAYENGLELGLGPGGQQARYVVRAVAMKPPDMGDSAAVSSGVVIVQPQAATPQILPTSPGPYTNEVEVTITCQTPGATIHYTLDGTDPATSASRKTYSKSFALTQLMPTENVVRAVASRAGFTSSADASASFEVRQQACTPSFGVPAGVFVTGVPVSIECRRVAHENVHYTLDGTDPTEDSPTYNDPVRLSPAAEGNVTVRAASFGENMAPSSVVTSPQYDVRPDPRCKAGEYEPFVVGPTTTTARRRPGNKWSFTAHSCLSCPPGGISEPDSVGVLSCVASKGHVGQPGGPFQPCPVGSYKEVEGQGECQPCPDQSSTGQAASTQAADCRALPGSHGADGGPFAECGPGTYSDRMGQEECTPCPHGSTSQGRRATSMQPCIALPGWTHATSWDVGPFVRCDKGTYKAVSGPAGCKACPECSTTTKVGATAAKECVADQGCEGKGFGWEIGFAMCPLGTWKDWIGNGQCDPCPADVDMSLPAAKTCRPAHAPEE